MLNKIKAWLAPPTFSGDEEQTLLVNLLNANMLFINAYVLLVIVSYVFGMQMTVWVVVFNALLLVSIMIFRNWLFKGRVKAAGVGLLIAGFIAITLVTISMGTITSPATNTYVLIVMLAGVIFRQRGLYLSTLGTSLAVLGLIIAENAGLLPAAIDLVIIPQWLTYSMMFLISGSLIHYSMQTMRKALDSLRKEMQERKQAAILQEAVYRIAEAAQSTESLQELYSIIQSQISKVMYANNFYIALYDETADLLDFAFSIDELDNGYIPPFRPIKGLTAYVLKNGTSLLFWPGGPNSLEMDFHTNGMDCVIWLGVPLIVRGKAIGVMVVQHYTDMQAYTEREQRILEFVSSQVAIVIDRKQTEEKLRESNDRFRQIADNIQEVFWMWDIEKDKPIYISPAYKLLWGVSPESLYKNQSQHVDLILPEDRPVMIKALAKQSAGMQTEINYRVQRPDGTICWVWDRSFPVFDDNGKLVRKAGVATDITNVKTAEFELEKLNQELEKRVEDRTMQLKQSEETYRALFENSNDGIFLLSPEGFELRANQRALDMVGYTLEEYQDMSSLSSDEFAAPDEQDHAMDRIRAIVSGEDIPLYEKIFVTKDGRKLNVEINLSVIRDADGQVAMVQSVVRDITSRKKAELALRQSRDDLSAANLALEKASRLKDEFLASMSHELRTPLTGILGLSEALQMQTHGTLTDKQLKALRNIESSGWHLLELINDILDLSKIEADKLDLQFENCLVSDICNSSLQLTRGMAYQKHQNVKFSTNVVDAVVRADPRRLKQMLVNLLSNAIKFTPEQGSLGLEVNGSREQQLIIFTVWDKGIGIRSEDRERLFKPFVQLDASLSRQYSGTGLGLSLVERLVKMHDGSVNVESSLGEGSRFTITLPWKEGGTSLGGISPLFAQGSAPVKESDARDNSPKQSTILFADDNEIIVTTISDFLREHGFVVITASSGIELVKFAPFYMPDLILADIQMSGMDGLQAIMQIRAMENAYMKQVPIIALTALAMPGDEERCLQAGANKYITKPVSLENLLQTLQIMMVAPNA